MSKINWKLFVLVLALSLVVSLPMITARQAEAQKGGGIFSNSKVVYF
jgi:hypothetical protein